MTLQDFCNMHFSKNGRAIVDVFIDVSVAQRYIEEEEDVFPYFTIESDFQMLFILNNRWSEAKVNCFYAVEKDHIAVVVHPKEDRT